MSLTRSYDAVASEYTKRIYSELQYKPKDRELLDSVALDLGTGAKVCDLGCGPGHVTAYLLSKNLSVSGIDISPGMIDEAKRLNPSIHFRLGNMLELPFNNNELDGVVAYYSIIHLDRSRLRSFFREVKRVIRPNGLFLFSFHIGNETVHLDTWWDKKVDVDFHFFTVSEIQERVIADFEIVEIVEREPYAPSVEHQSRRAYFCVKNVQNTIQI